MKKCFDWVNNNKVLSGLLLVGVVLVVVPLAVYGLSVGTVFPNGGNDWSGFWGGYLGAIIGAIVALFGVIITLQETRSQFKEDKRIEHAPLLKIVETKNRTKESFEDICYVLDPDHDQRIATCLNIRNVGLGPVIYFEIKNLSFTNGNRENCPNLNGFTGEGCTKEIMGVGYEFSIPVEIDFKKPIIGKVEDRAESARVGSFLFDIIYMDIFENKYKQSIRLFLNMDVDWKNKNIIEVTLHLSNVTKSELI